MATSSEGLTAELAEALLNLRLNGVLIRIDERGQRCGDLFQWALHPQNAMAGSPLAADDAEFEATYPLTKAGPQAVTDHALFPAISAAEGLHTAGVLVARRRSHRQPHLTEVLQLCRVVMESAALTIWLLNDPAREVRRDRCMSQEMEQLEQRRRYLVICEEDEVDRPARYPQQLLRMNAAHRDNYNRMLTKAKAAYTFAKMPFFTTVIRSSAQWVDAHIPAHDTEEIAANGMECAARSLYSYGSSFIHGYKWMTDYTRDGTVFTLLADALAVALNMAECAVCLFEAASRAPGGARPEESHVPERFEPTIASWSRDLFGA